VVVVAIELFDPCDRSREALERVAGKIEIKGMFQRGVSLMRRKDLNVPPRETDEVWFELRGGIADGLASLCDGKERQIENALAYLRFPAMDKVRQVGNPDGIDLRTGEENVEEGFDEYVRFKWSRMSS